MKLHCSRAALWFILSSVSISRISGLSSSSDSSSASRMGKDPSSRGRPSARPSSTATTDVPNSSDRTRKRRAVGAPLVDSTLLRFVSEQKRRQEEQKAWATDLDQCGSGATPSGTAESIAFPTLDERNATSRLISATTPDTVNVLSAEDVLNAMAESIQRQEQGDPWLGQYNRHRVAQELVAEGADTEAAMEAGEKIQSYVLTRTARRRIRIFLRERDSLWNVPDDELPADDRKVLVESKVSRMGAAQPKYEFNDNIAVMLEHGLTGKDICTILTHTPSVAMMMPKKSFLEHVITSTSKQEETAAASSDDTLEETLQRAFVELLQKDLGLRKYDARKVLRSCPGLLSVRGSQAAVQNVIMMTKLGVSMNSIGRDKTTLPLLLSRSPAAVFRLVSFLCSDKVRMPIKSIGPLLRRPVSRELLNLAAPVPKLQSSLLEEASSEENALGPYEESAVWGRYREERAQTINALYRNMTATAKALRFEIGAKDLGKLISAYPSVLLLDAETQILPTASFLIEELGIWEDGLAGVLQQYPLLLGKDIEEMRKVTAFLAFIGVQSEDMGSMFRAFPALLSMDIEKQMTPVVEFLVGIGVSDVGAFVTTLPPVLGYSVEKELRPKWNFLERVCLRPTFEINNFPAFFSYPLDRVIKTRYEYLAAKGIARQLVPVDAVVRFGDEDFAVRIARDDDGGKLFKSFCEKRKGAAGAGNNPSRRQRQRNTKRHPRANSS